MVCIIGLYCYKAVKTQGLHSGDGEIRTLDPLLARQVLSQLSYAPIFIIRQPPALPYRLQYSTIGRLGLNHRVRDVMELKFHGCLPRTHRHRKLSLPLADKQ